MTFAVPLFLLATLAAAIPVVLHLVNRQKARQLPFSTLRFLRVSVQKTRRRKQVHDLLLLVLRAGVLVLLALGLARPALTGLGTLFGGEATAVAIVLDNSLSMGVRTGEGTRFDAAKAAAIEVLGQMREGDEVALFLTGGPVFPEQGRRDRTGETVRQMLAQVQVSYERADLGAALRQARTLLAETDAPNRRLFVISDMQEHSWDTLRRSRDAAGAEVAEDPAGAEIPVILVDCHGLPEANVAVTDVSVEAPIPATGLPVQARVELTNSAAAAQRRHVELYVNGTLTAASPAVEVPPQGRASVDLSFAFRQGGIQRGEVRLAGEDGSPFDDRRFFAMEIDRGIPVAVVKNRAHEIPHLDDTFYLEAALDPGGGEGWAMRPTVFSAERLPAEPLDQYAVIYCVNLAAPDGDTAERLAAYVAGGGNLVWIAGEQTDPEAYNAMDASAGGGLLPAPLADARTPGVEEGRDSWYVAALDVTHPALGQLAEPASLYQSVLVYRHIPLEAPEAPEIRVLARLDNGAPLLVQRRSGRGTTTFLGTSVHVGWTNLPLRPVFLPLFARLTFDLAGAEQARPALLPGAPLTIPFAAGRRPASVEVQPPDGELIRRQVAPEEPAFQFADTHRIGVYRVRLIEPGQIRAAAFAVNFDAEEAGDRPIERGALEDLLHPAPLLAADDPRDLSALFTGLREGRGLWHAFLAAVLAGLVLEGFLANRFTPRHGERGATGRASLPHGSWVVPLPK